MWGLKEDYIPFTYSNKLERFVMGNFFDIFIFLSACFYLEVLFLEILGVLGGGVEWERELTGG